MALSIMLFDMYEQRLRDAVDVRSCLHDETNEQNICTIVAMQVDERAKYAAVPGLDGLLLFEIKTRSTNAITGEVEIYCESAVYELLTDMPLEDVRPTNVTAQSAAQMALQGTRWQVGNVITTPQKSVRWWYINPMQALQSVCSTWGVRYVARILVSGTSISARIIDLVSAEPVWRGKRFELGKDLLDAQYVLDKRSVVTAIHPRGKGEESGDGYGPRLGISEVSWSKAAGDPVDKPLGQKYIEISTATQAHGIMGTRARVTVQVYPDIEDPVELMRAAWADLQESSQPVLHGTFGVVDLERLGMPHEKVRLNDEAAFVAGDLRVKSLVVGIRREYAAAGKDQITFGAITESAMRQLHAAKQDIRRAETRTEAARYIAEGAFDLAAQQAQLINEAKQDISEAQQQIADAQTQIADASEQLASVEGVVEDHGLRIEQTETALESKAEQTVLDTLAGTVSSQGTQITQNAQEIASKASQNSVDTLAGTVSSQGTQITQNAQEIASKASQSSVDTLAGTVGSQGTQITQNAQEIASKASQSSVDTLAGTVSSQGTAITQNSQAISAKASQSSVDALNGRVESAEAELELVPGQITAAVSDMQIGGRNHIPNSAYRESYAPLVANGTHSLQVSTGWGLPGGQNALRISTSAASTSDTTDRAAMMLPTALSDGVVFSFYARSDQYVILRVRLVSNTAAIHECHIDTPNVWKKFVIKVPPGTTADRLVLSVRAGGYNVWMHSLMLEEGNKETPWTPAHEDAQSQITQLSIDLDAAEAAITLKAETSVTDGLNARLNSAELKLTQEYITTWVRNHAAYKADLAAKSKVTALNTAPSGAIVNDLWIDTANGNILKRWTGSAWVEAQDDGISQAQQTANKFSWLIASGTSGSDMTLTERLYQLMTDRVMITANEEITLAVEDMQVGGRNHIPNSAYRESYAPLVANGTHSLQVSTGWGLPGGQNALRISTSAASTSDTTDRAAMMLPTALSDGVVFSFYARSDQYVILRVRLVSNTAAIHECHIDTPNVWKKFVIKVPPGTTADRLVLSVRAGGYNVWMHSPMMEEGNKETPWTPAPEDPASGVKTAGIEIGPGTYKHWAATGSANEIGVDNTRSDGLWQWAGGSPSNAKIRMWMNGAARFDQIMLGNSGVNLFTQMYPYSDADNADADNSMIIKVFVPAECAGVQSLKLSFTLEAFRAYSKAAASGGSATLTAGESYTDDGMVEINDHPATNTGFAGGHSHEFAGSTTSHVSDHRHSISARAHTVAYHRHPIGQHTHSLQAHSHGITYGIYKGATATSCQVIVDGTNIGSFASLTARDITAQLTKASGKVTRDTWHTIEIKPNGMTRIVAQAFLVAVVATATNAIY